MNNLVWQAYVVFCFSPLGQRQRDTTATGPYGLMRMRIVQGQNNNKSRPELALSVAQLSSTAPQHAA